MTTKELLLKCGFEYKSQSYKNANTQLSRLRYGVTSKQMNNKYIYEYPPKLDENDFEIIRGRVDYNESSYYKIAKLLLG